MRENVNVRLFYKYAETSVCWQRPGEKKEDEKEKGIKGPTNLKLLHIQKYFNLSFCHLQSQLTVIKSSINFKIHWEAQVTINAPRME